MQKAHLNFIKYALKNNCKISVWDGEEWQVKKSEKYNDIKEAVESVDYSQLRVRNGENEIVAWVKIVLDYDQDPDEIINDYSDNDFMQLWADSYYQ